MNDLELMRIRADTLFRYDVRGRMLISNELDGTPAPRVWLGCTATGHVVRFGATLPDQTAGEIATLIAALALDGDLHVPNELRAAVRAALAAHAPVEEGEGGPAYRFPAAISPPAGVVALTSENRGLVRDTFPWLYDEIEDWGRPFAVIRDDAAVSICFSSRVGEHAEEAGLQTLPEDRKQGFGSAVSLAWAAGVRENGRTPLYSTSWSNDASRAVARKLRLKMIGSDVAWV